MKNIILAFPLAALMTFSSIGPLQGQTVTFNPAFNSYDMLYEPVPSGHTPGKDNGPGVGKHNTGEDCGICHTPGGKASNYVFTTGGTIYEDRAARRPLKGVEVILKDYNGNIISMTTNEVGNFWTYAPLASNPYSVASHGGTTEKIFAINPDGSVTPGDPKDPRTWQFKAWIKNPDGAVRSMITLPPIGGSTLGSTPRMGCSMHHSRFGGTGAAWASRKNTLASYPATNLGFKKHILPIFVSKCAPCHVPGSRPTRLVTISDLLTNSTTTNPPLTHDFVTTIDYSGGRDWQSYDGTWGGTAVPAKKGIKDVTLPYVSDPDSSPVLSLTKVRNDNVMIHPGGTFWTPDDPDYKAIRQWIVEGAQNN